MNRRLFLQWPALALAAPRRPLPAFPGAEGFGAYTRGGRYGAVRFVTNLNDSGPGSLRAAVEAYNPRTILFRVAGVISLQSPLVVKNPFVTIAGQTAPGDGVCLRRFGLVVDTHDVVIRFLRSRPGDEAGQEVDGISIVGNSRNVIVDHCSASWSIDECLSVSGTVADITVQWCLIAEGLHRSIHGDGPHSMGSLIRAVGGVSLHHNLWLHHDSRNPRLGHQQPDIPVVYDVRNNVMYNYGTTCSGLADGSIRVNYAGNYIKPGPFSRPGRTPIIMHKFPGAQFYLEGNRFLGDEKLSADNRLMIDRPIVDGLRVATIVPKPFDAPPVTTTSAAEAYQAVLKGVGALRPTRDKVDQRLLADVAAGTGAIIDSQWEVGGWPEYRAALPPRDADRNGLPDDLPPSAQPSDGVAPDEEYSPLERYLNHLAEVR
ncbi:hypothetical protein [uncultured Paludibaculum sp.]|uniref:pectate lyase family protein n=1 Tax=uncultured Paludibaculum sp. TaxID=1765020 RepID=UPI002AAACC31|nr:hypothetical protein [uncultured Paludibaculum sp.]